MGSVGYLVKLSMFRARAHWSSRDANMDSPLAYLKAPRRRRINESIEPRVEEAAMGVGEDMENRSRRKRVIPRMVLGISSLF